MEEGAVRVEPQAYRATIGAPGRGMGPRIAAVCAALVSLLAVSCSVLLSGSGTAAPARGLPGFELSLNSAMETFFQNTVAREQKEAAAQRLSVRQLALAPKHADRLAAGPPAQASARPPAVVAAPSPTRPPAAAKHTTDVTAPSAHEVAERTHAAASRGTAPEASKKEGDREEFLKELHGMHSEHMRTRAQQHGAKMRGAKMEGLATKPAGMHGLDNKPWTAPSSDFSASNKRPQALAEQADFDVSFRHVPCSASRASKSLKF
jgi:hypothetical protein